MRVDKILSFGADAMRMAKTLSDKSGLSDSLAALVSRADEARVLSVPPPPGTPLLCSLGRFVEHSGIYLGDSSVAELEGAGKLRKVSLTTFLNGDEGEGFNPRDGRLVYAACDDLTGRPLSSPETAENARRYLAEHSEVGYNIFSSNCHLFTMSCVLGRFLNDDAAVAGRSRKEKLLGEIGRALHAMGDDSVNSILKLECVIKERLNCGKPMSWLGVVPMDDFRYALSRNKMAPNYRQALGEK